MKKIICYLIVFLLLQSSSAFSEENRILDAAKKNPGKSGAATACLATLLTPLSLPVCLAAFALGLTYDALGSSE